MRSDGGGSTREAIGYDRRDHTTGGEISHREQNRHSEIDTDTFVGFAAEFLQRLETLW